MGTQKLYIQSKYVGPRVFDLFCCVLTRLQGNVVFSNTLARKYGDQGIVSTSLNPGNLKSDLQRHLNSIQSVIVVCCGFCNHHMFCTYAFPRSFPPECHALPCILRCSNPTMGGNITRGSWVQRKGSAPVFVMVHLSSVLIPFCYYST